MKIVRFISLFLTLLIVLFGHLSRAADDSEFVKYLKPFLEMCNVPPRAYIPAIDLTRGDPIENMDALRAILDNHSSPQILNAYTLASRIWNRHYPNIAAGRLPPGFLEDQIFQHFHPDQSPPFRQPWQTPTGTPIDELMGQLTNLRINTTHRVGTSYPSGSSSARIMSRGRQFYPGESSTSRIMTVSSQFRPRGSPPARTTYSRSRAGRSQNPSQQHRSQEQDEGSPSSVWIQTAARDLRLHESSIRYLYQHLYLLHRGNPISISDERPIEPQSELTYGDLRNLQQFQYLWNESRRTTTRSRRGRRGSSSRGRD